MAVIERWLLYRHANLYMDLSHLGLELGGCNNEMAALQSDCYTEVPLYIFHKATNLCVRFIYANYAPVA